MLQTALPSIDGSQVLTNDVLFVKPDRQLWLAVPFMNLSGVYVTSKNPLEKLGGIMGQIAVNVSEMIRVIIMIFSPPLIIVTY